MLPSAGMLVHPCLIDGKISLVYEKGLDGKDPDAYRYIKNYARLNKLHLKEDQRNSFERVDNERRKNIMPMMALGASMLFSKPVLSSPLDDLLNDKEEITEVGFKKSKASHQKEINKDEMIKNLLNWVGENSTFDVSPDDLPEVKVLSSDDMLKVAFLGRLPKKMNAQDMGILGLFSFHDQTVYILDSIDLDTEEGRAILLHELVHYLQYKDGEHKHVDCKNELERLAYQLEAEYLHDHNHRVTFSESHVDRVSQCS